MNTWKTVRSILLVIFLVFAALLLSNCQAFRAEPSALSDEEVGQVVDRILNGLNAGDYQAFSQDFGDTMKNTLNESEFNKIRTMLQETSGNYLSRSKPSLLNNQGYAIYRFPCKFEKEDVIVTVTFKINGDKVEGLFFDSNNLRKVSK